MKGTIALLGSTLRSIGMRVSPGFHARACSRYWSSVDSTHADMRQESFDTYADHIARLLGRPDQIGRVLDHGAGDGQIGMRLAKAGYDVEFSEFAPQFIERIRSAGFTCYQVDEVPMARFDTIFVNNAIFYVHPSHLVERIRWLLERVADGGSLLLLDVPTHQRSRALGAKPLKRLVWRATDVYQPDAGGFFVDEERVRHHFKDVRVLPSWCDYRCHLIIRKA